VNIKENIKSSAKESLGLHELKQHKQWFDEECLGFLDQRKQDIMQWVQDPSQIIVDNLNNVRREASKHFRNTKKAYLKAKIEELENNSKIKNISDLYSDISDFNKDYQPRTNTVKDENGDMGTDPAVFWLGGGTISFSSSIYMGLMMLGRQNYRQQNNQCLSQVPLRLSWPLKC